MVWHEDMFCHIQANPNSEIAYFIIVSILFASTFHQLTGTQKRLVIHFSDQMVSPHTIIVEIPSLTRGNVLMSSAIVLRGAKTQRENL